MRLVSRLETLLQASLLLLGVAGPALSQGQGQVPHRGSFVGSGTPSIVQGQATLLGNFQGVGTVLAQTPTGILGQFVWTGAHGDAISGTFELTLTGMISPGVFTFVETAVITGGTGRFANASGQATAVGVINVVTSDFWGEFDGLMTGVGIQP